MGKHTRRNTTVRKRATFDAVQLRATRNEADGTCSISGYAAVFDQPAHGEVIKPGAFTKSLAESADVRLLVNHAGVPLARTKSGTLELEQDDHGLKINAPGLDIDNPTVAELVSALDRGDIDQMSFGFWPVDESYNHESGVWEVREVDIDDVSVVTYPWYQGTEAALDRGLAKLHEGRALTRAERAAVEAAVDAAETPAPTTVQDADETTTRDTDEPTGMSLAEARARIGA